jgi:hypothetical protein
LSLLGLAAQLSAEPPAGNDGEVAGSSPIERKAGPLGGSLNSRDKSGWPDI